MRSGSNKRFCMKVSYGMSLTTSMIRPAVLMPAFEYWYFVPGSNSNGVLA